MAIFRTYRLWNGWNGMRWLRMGMGILILGSGMDGGEWAPALLGGILIIQALLNIGCVACAGGRCSIAAEAIIKRNKK